MRVRNSTDSLRLADRLRVPRRAGQGAVPARAGAYGAKLAARAAKTAATGRKPSGRLPPPPQDAPQPEDQINQTDEDSRIMRIAGGGFEQCYNAQAAVAADSLLVVARHPCLRRGRRGAGDQRQAAAGPMIQKLAVLPAELGEPETLLADNAYFSAADATACEAARIVPMIVTGREAHYPSLAPGVPAQQRSDPTTQRWRLRARSPFATSRPAVAGPVPWRIQACAYRRGVAARSGGPRPVHCLTGNRPSPGGHKLVLDCTPITYAIPSSLTPSRNAVSTPYPASASTISGGTPARRAVAICGLVANATSSGAPALARRSASLAQASGPEA